MILTGHQPNYLPYLGFFHKASQVDMFVVVDNVQFVKRGPFGWMNRNLIRTDTGTQWLTVPVLTKGKFTQKVNETRINNEIPWQRKHWLSIVQHYRRAPYFSRFEPFFEDLYRQKWEYLAELSESIIYYIIKALGIQAQIKKASELGVEGKGTDLIVDMCRKTGATRYLHGKHGKDYIDEQKFKEAGIECLYQDFVHPVYSQCYEPFIPNLSIIDLLFNCGDKSLEVLCGKSLRKG